MNDQDQIIDSDHLKELRNYSKEMLMAMYKDNNEANTHVE